MDPVIIIGTGLAGYMLAKEWRKLDTQTPLLIITASDGRFYSKPLLSTALSSKKTPEMLAVADAEGMATQLQATLLTKTRVTTIDTVTQTVWANEKAYRYSKLVLALGAEVIKPDLKGDAVTAAFYVNDLEDYTRFRQDLQPAKTIGIIGSGLVGCEFANDLINSGHQVNIISPTTYPLMSLVPPAIGQVLQQAFAAEGVQWYLGQAATAINHYQQRLQIEIKNPAHLLVDKVLIATGLRPQIQLAKQAGIHVSRGIVVDRYLQTSVENVYALGDCAEVNGLVLLFVAPLLNCARALAKTLTGVATRVAYPAMPVVIKTPTCPIVVSPPPSDVVGEWQVKGEAKHFRALYYDQQQQLRGFALTGNCVNEKNDLTKQLPPFFE